MTAPSRPYEELVREAEKARLLLDAARYLGESLEPERVYDRFHELLADVVEHDGVVVSSCDDDGMIRCDYAWSDGVRLDESKLPPLPLNREGHGMQSRVIVSGEPLAFNDVGEVVQHEPGTYYDVDREGTMRKVPDAGPPKTRAALMVPVKLEGSVLGVVQIMSDRARYSTEELELVEGLVSQMAAAVRNARLQKERRRLEAAEAAARAVAAEREQAAYVLEAVGDGIFLLDDGGLVRLWNRAAELVTGLVADRVVGRSADAALESWEGLVGRIPVAESGASPRSVTLPVAVGGRDLWLSFVAVRGAAGVVYAFRDLTSERRLEEEKTDLVATISHELRTPLAAVYGAAQTLLGRDDLPPERRRQLLQMIAAQAARLSTITESVLLTSRLDRGVVEVERESVDVAELARATVEAMREQLPESVSLELESGPDAVNAAGDADRIQQVLVNLLDNAVKYGGGSPVTVRVDPADGVVRLSVQDEGPGLSPAEQARVFEKFYRAGPQLTRTGGTGLGLYISRELARRMGGRLDVRSEAGAGATFILELPRS
ncbi:MAG TPA: ATP-binding protein [Gaiellaceae bacterium]|nr:ATP-binding protein [Gaiellaceae bacterium]